MRSGPIAAAREGRHTPERKKQELTCAERPNRRCQGRQAHAVKEKARADVCGAAQSPLSGKAGTRRKEKSKSRRVRSGPIAAAREGRHTPKRKTQELTCAERPNRRCKGGQAHARKEKARNDVCGAAQSPLPGKEGTRRKRKSKK